MRVGAIARPACSGVWACNGVQACAGCSARGARMARMRGRKDDMAGTAPNNPSESTPRFQDLVLRGARNVRDLGGYPFMAEGGQTGTTAHGAFLRGDALGGLRTQDFARLDRYACAGLSTFAAHSRCAIGQTRTPRAGAARGKTSSTSTSPCSISSIRAGCAARFLAACRMCISSCSITMRRASVL